MWCNVPVGWDSESGRGKGSVGLRGKVWLVREGVLVGFWCPKKR
jgi:hypothetical protein